MPFLNRIPVLGALPEISTLSSGSFIPVAAAVGLVCVGTLFSAMATNTRLAELLLPMLALPFFVPVVMPAAQVTAKLLSGRPMAEAWPWLRILLGFDLVVLVACAVVFRYTVEE